jgi:hypothetical protein
MRPCQEAEHKGLRLSSSSLSGVYRLSAAFCTHLLPLLHRLFCEVDQLKALSRRTPHAKSGAARKKTAFADIRLGVIY